MGRALTGETEPRGERCKSAARRCDVEWHGASQQTSGREATENEIGISPSRLVATSPIAGWSRSGPGTERAEYCTHVHSSRVTCSPRQQRGVLCDIRSAMTALWRCLTAPCREAPFLPMLDDHISSSHPKKGCLTTTCRRVSCHRVRDGCVSQSTPGGKLVDHMSSSDLGHVRLTTFDGYAVSVTAFSEVAKRAGGLCLMARCRRALRQTALYDGKPSNTKLALD